MKRVESHNLQESFLLFLDNKLLKNGEAYTNTSSLFYDTNDNFVDLYTFGAPFQGIVADESITGADILSGVYLDGSFTERGESDFTGINFDAGQVYFGVESPATEISGNYAVKDFRVETTTLSEETLLFKRKFSIKPRTVEQKAALDPNTFTYPAIFLKTQRTENDPFEFGGRESTIMDFRAIVVADSLFLLEGAESIFRDLVRETPAKIKPSELPFDMLGDVYNNSYHYDDLVKNKPHSELMYIENVIVSRTNNDFFRDQFNAPVFVSFVDFEVRFERKPRNC